MNPRASCFTPSPGKLLAAIPAIVCASQARAVIVYTDLSPGLAAPSIYFSLGGGLDGSRVSTSVFFNYQFNVFQKGSATQMAVGSVGTQAIAYPGGIDPDVTFFSAGDLIDFNPVSGASGGSLPSVATGYLGLAVNVGGQWDYGWAEVTTTGGPNLILLGFAYDDTGAAIRAGQTSAIPEPGSTAAIAGLVSGSLVAFAARRKRKAAASVAA